MLGEGLKKRAEGGVLVIDLQVIIQWNILQGKSEKAGKRSSEDPNLN